MDDEWLDEAFEAGAERRDLQGRAPGRARHAAARGRRRATSCTARARRASSRAAEDCPLTTRELEILRLAAQGYTNGQIARELWVTEQTVKFHLSNTYRKLGVANRTEASRYAYVHGLVGADERSPPDAAAAAVEPPRRRSVRPPPSPSAGVGAGCCAVACARCWSPTRSRWCRPARSPTRSPRPSPRPP